MKCLICDTLTNVRNFRCRVCGRWVGAYCEGCWLEQKLFEQFEANCRNGKAHTESGKTAKKGGEAT